MRQVRPTTVIAALLAALVFGAGSNAQAQTGADHSPWSVDFGIGFDNDLSGHVNSSAIGTLNGQTVVILANSYEEVYGTGLHLRGGVGYTIGDSGTELRATIAFQSLDADFVTPLGDIGASKLYAQYTDYQSLSLDVGARQYRDLNTHLRAYGEAAIGLGFIDKIDATLVAPTINLSGKANDLYDQTVAMSLSGNLGLLYQTSDRVGIFGQFGLRWMSGLAQVDDLVGTGLETINDKSSRWTMPFVAGVRFQF
jgi:hypothetical protein